VIEDILKQVGLQTIDDRLYKLVAVAVEAKLDKIVQEAKEVNSQALKEPKTHLSNDDLQKSMEDEAVYKGLPPFVEDVSKSKK